MSWKRLFLSVLAGLLIIIVDGLLLILINRIYLPAHPPHWLMGLLFYFDAWPVTLTQHLFPSRHGGASLPAILSGAVVDLVILTGIVYALLSWRARHKAR